MGVDKSQSFDRDNKAEKTKAAKPRKPTFKKALACAFGVLSFGLAGKASAQDAGPAPDADQITDAGQTTRTEGRNAAEALRTFIREGTSESREAFLTLYEEHSGDEQFRTDLETEIAALIRVDGEGRPTADDSFLSIWAESQVAHTCEDVEEDICGDTSECYGGNACVACQCVRVDYSELIPEIEALRRTGVDMANALRNFLLTGQEGERERFQEIFDSEYLGAPRRENYIFANAFIEAVESQVEGNEEARAIERAYASSLARVAAAIHDCYERVGEGEISAETRTELETSHGTEFVEVFLRVRPQLELDGQEVPDILLYLEDMVDCEDEERVEERNRVVELQNALGYNFSELVRDVAAVYAAFAEDETDAEAVRGLEERYGRALVELIEARASQPELDERETARLERRYRLIFQDTFSALLNIDRLIRPDEDSSVTEELDRYRRTHDRRPVSEQLAFARWAADAIAAWERVNTDEIGAVREYFRRYFPRLPQPSEDHIERFRAVMQVMKAFVSHGSFRFDNYMEQLQDSASSFSSYVNASSRIGTGEWSEEDQQAFTAIVTERVTAVRRERLPRRVRYPEEGAGGAELAENLLPTPIHSIGQTDRATVVQELEARVLIADMLVDTVFGYDWEVIAGLRMGELSREGPHLFDEEGQRQLMRLSGIARLAFLHKTVMESSEFTTARSRYFSFISGPASTGILDLSTTTDADEAEERLGSSRYLEMLEDMDLLTQYAFYTSAFPAVSSETGLTTLDPYEEEEAAGTAEERAATAEERVRYIFDEIELFVDGTGRGGHVGFMLYAVPLALEYADNYNSAVTILNRIIATSSTITNTSMYDYAGRGRVAFRYMMEQVPRNFEEANNDAYNQLIDMMLRNPTASDYQSRDMERDMFDTQTIGEMFREYMRIVSERSSALRPEHIYPRRAPQDFNFAGALMMMEDNIRINSRTDYRGLLTDTEFEEDDDTRESTIQEIITGSRDENMLSLWTGHVDMHEEFLAFFRPESVSLIDERDYTVRSFIPMSISSLLRRLSSVEGVDRLIYPIDIRSIEADASVIIDHGSFEQVSGGTPTERASSREASGSGRLGLAARIWGPAQEIEISGEANYTTMEDLETATEADRWDAVQEVFASDVPLFTERITGRSRFTAAEGSETDRTETPAFMRSEVTDVRLIDALDWYAQAHDTDGAIYISGIEQGRTAERDVDGELETEDESSHDWRVHAYGKINNRWYRVGYIDVSDERLRRFFIGMQAPQRWRDFGEARVLAGGEPRRDETPGEEAQEIEVEETWRLEGALIGLNLSNLIGWSAYPTVTLANIENFGRAVDDLMEDLPEEEQGVLEMRRMEEYANGISLLFGEHRPVMSGLVRTVGFITGTARRYRRTVVTEPVGDGPAVEEEHDDDDWHGGGGAVVRMTGPGRDEGDDDQAMEFGLAVGEEIGTDGFREVEVQWTETTEDGEVTHTEWRPAGGDLADGEEIVSERRTYRERQERIGLTAAWRTEHALANGLHTNVVAQTEAFENVRGLLGFCYDTNPRETDGDDNIHTFGMFGGQYDPFYETHEAHGIFGIRTGNTRVQLTGMYSHMELITRIDEVNTRLEQAYRDISELRSGSPIPEGLEEGLSRGEHIEQLERDIEVYNALRTALGMIGAQKFFGTAQIVQRFGPRTRAALEALYGGFDEQNLLLNGWVEVDQAFALSYNMTAMPFGSAGTKVVVPIREFVLAATAGGYWRDDEEGGSGYAGLLWTRPGGRFGLGAIAGGGDRTSTFGTPAEDEDDEGTLEVERNRAEVMVLGWHPVRRARMQHYVVFSRTAGSNVWSVESVPSSEVETYRVGYGMLVRWIDRDGHVWRARGDLLWRGTTETRDDDGETGGDFSRDVVSAQLGVDVEPTEDIQVGIYLSLRHVLDSTDGIGSDAVVETRRTSVGGGGILRWEF